MLMSFPQWEVAVNYRSKLGGGEKKKELEDRRTGVMSWPSYVWP